MYLGLLLAVSVELPFQAMILICCSARAASPSPLLFRPRGGKSAVPPLYAIGVLSVSEVVVF